MSYQQHPTIAKGNVTKPLIILNILIASIYLSWWLNPSHIGNVILYSLLTFGEGYHVFMALTFWHTIWPRSKNSKPLISKPSNLPKVDIFITVAGEPAKIVEKTARAAKNLDYPNHKIYILNDGLVAKKDNWKEIENLAKNLNIKCITRTIPGGAKAGNINNALRQTKGKIVAIFDADMVMYPNFLNKVIPFFEDKDIGFVQTPQYYKNNHLNSITDGAWKQQELFFGPIMCGKDTTNSAFICGTNLAIRRVALEDVGGMSEDNIAEDFLTSLLIHAKGWKSKYIKEVLAEGLAPEDLLSYYKQQLRWARGSIEVLLEHNPLFKKGLSSNQKIQYLASGFYYLNGLISLIDMVMPLIFLFFGIKAVTTSTTTFAIFFIPFMFLNLYTLYLASGAAITFRAISFSQASFTLQLLALKSLIFHQKMGFSITPKSAQEGNFLFLSYPHLLYIFLVILGTCVGFEREGLNPSVATNLAWAMFNAILFLPFISSSIKIRNLFTNSPSFSQVRALKLKTIKI